MQSTDCRQLPQATANRWGCFVISVSLYFSFLDFFSCGGTYKRQYDLFGYSAHA